MILGVLYDHELFTMTGRYGFGMIWGIILTTQLFLRTNQKISKEIEDETNSYQ